MAKIKKFNQFVTEEAISGTEIPTMRNGSYFGPAYGDTVPPKTINKSHTTVAQSDNDGFYTEDEYNELRTAFLKSGGLTSELPSDGFSKENIDFMLAKLGK
jgi:hypothetical protein